MNERETKKIIQESLLSTSDGFVDNLMEKVESNEKSYSTIKNNWLLIVVILGVIALALLFVFLVSNTKLRFSLANNPFTMSPLLIFIGAVMFLLYQMNLLRDVLNNINTIKKMNRQKS